MESHTLLVEDSVAVCILFSCLPQGRVLVCADGAPSRMAQQLGLVSGPAQTSCSRSYIEGGTHRFKADGVLFYCKALLPGGCNWLLKADILHAALLPLLGYAALFRHANDEANFCVYLIPGNPNATDDTLAHWHEYMKKNDPSISKALGKNPKMERMKAGKNS